MINNDWDEMLKVVFEGEGFKKFYHLVEEEYRTKTLLLDKILIMEKEKHMVFLFQYKKELNYLHH